VRKNRRHFFLGKKLARLRRTSFFILLSALTLIFAIGGAWWFFRTPMEEFRSEKIAFRYPADYQAQPKSDPGSGQGVALVKLEISDPQSLVVLAEEKGASTGAKLTHTDFLDFLENNAARSFPLTYSSYQKNKVERIEISGRSAALFSFRYLGKDGKTSVFVDFFIIPVGEDAYYLTIQSVDESRLRKDTAKIQPTITIQ